MTQVGASTPSYGLPARGITGRDVELAADALLRAGERPTIERVRERIGRGSPNTINPLLDAWWKRLAARLDAGPPALHRLPETVAHVAEALWLQALEEGRRRAQAEITREVREAARASDDLQVRSHVLSLREGELESRLKDRALAQAALESELRELTVMLRKEQATRERQAERIAVLEQELSVKRSATLPTRTPRKRPEKTKPLKRTRRGQSPKRAAQLKSKKSVSRRRRR